jgi:hypothetical protein
MNTMGGEGRTDERPVFFGHAPEYRRCGIYFLVGYLLIVATAAGLQLIGVGRGWSAICGLALIAAVPMLGFARFFLRKWLRVDERGLWHRRFLYWGNPRQAGSIGRMA